MMDTLGILTLLQIEGVGRRTVDALYRLSTEVMEDDIGELIRLGSSLLPKREKALTAAAATKARASAAAMLEDCRKRGYGVVSIADRTFPRRLLLIPDRPVLLFYRGDLEKLSYFPCVSVIGTRCPTAAGSEAAFQLGAMFGKLSVPVVSGLALGCDTAGHRGCLQVGGYTAATLPAGLNTMYPPENRELAQMIIDQGGCLLSEYPPGSQPAPYHFIERDRLQSGLSEVVIVVQTEIDGGTMHTAKFARQHLKELVVFTPESFGAGCRQTEGNRKLLAGSGVLPVSSVADVQKLIDSTLR